jgi:hypothetical protein
MNSIDILRYNCAGRHPPLQAPGEDGFLKLLRPFRELSLDRFRDIHSAVEDIFLHSDDDLTIFDAIYQLNECSIAIYNYAVNPRGPLLKNHLINQDAADLAQKMHYCLRGYISCLTNKRLHVNELSPKNVYDGNFGS